MTTLHDLQELFSERNPMDVAIEINGFTGFRTTLLEELTNEEINALYRIHKPEEKTLEAECDALKYEILRKGWKSKIIALAEREGIKEKHCYQKFNNWMLLYSRFKKHLNAHSLEELQLLHRQLHQLKNNNAQSARKAFTKAWYRKGIENKNLN